MRTFRSQLVSGSKADSVVGGYATEYRLRRIGPISGLRDGNRHALDSVLTCTKSDMLQIDLIRSTQERRVEWLSSHASGPTVLFSFGRRVSQTNLH